MNDENDMDFGPTEGEENSLRANEIADEKLQANRRLSKDSKKRIDMSDRSKEAALEKLTARNSSVQ